MKNSRQLIFTFPEVLTLQPKIFALYLLSIISQPQGFTNMAYR